MQYVVVVNRYANPLIHSMTIKVDAMHSYTVAVMW
jgi:hypothetical protein